MISVWNYIAKDDPAQADRMMHRIDQRLRALAENPRMGSDRSEVKRGLRSVSLGNYVLFYRMIENGIHVSRVLHAARDIRKAGFD